MHDTWYRITPAGRVAIPVTEVPDLTRQIAGESEVPGPLLASSRVGVAAKWTVRERNPRSGLWLPVVRRKNLFTNFGLTALASAIGGVYSAPLWLAINNTYTTMFAAYAAGVTTIQTNGDPTLVGDTQLVLSAGLAAQETVTFTAKNGAGPYTWTLSSATVNAHALNDPVARAITQADTLASFTSEQQYDSVNAPGQRMMNTAGYSTGTGNYIVQFYMSGNQATNVYFVTIGLVDSSKIGQGNLHNAVVLGYNHTTTNDVEIDGSVTLVNN